MKLKVELEDPNEVAKILLKLLEVYTPPGSEFKLHKTLFEISEKLGFEESYVDEVGNFFAAHGKGPTILLASHLDTVPGKLDVSFDGEIVRGRGAVDAKGPFLSYLLAGSAARSISGVRIQVAGLVREELDGVGANHLVEKKIKVDHVLIGEPTNLGIAIAYRGSITVKAYAKARGGHSSAPYIGESALDKLLTFLNDVKSRFNGLSYDEVTSAITTLNAGDWPGRLPEKACAHVNLRFPKSYQPNSLMSQLSEVAEKNDVNLKIIDSTPPVEVGLNSKIVRALIRSCLRNGLKPRLVKKTGTSDMNTLAELTKSIAAFGPGNSRLAHTRNEEISIQEIIKAAKIITAAISELSK